MVKTAAAIKVELSAWKIQASPASRIGKGQVFMLVTSKWLWAAAEDEISLCCCAGRAAAPHPSVENGPSCSLPIPLHPRTPQHSCAPLQPQE